MRHTLSLFLVLCLTLTSCHTRQSANEDTVLSSDTIRYAQGIRIQHYEGYTTVEVNDPWDSRQLLQRYILVERNTTVPGNLPAGTVVRVPIKNVVVYTSVHAGIIDLLGETDKIIGVCEPRYMDSPTVREGVLSGRIADLGEATSPNVEKIIEIGTEIIIASPFQNNNYGPVEKIGLPIIEGADYMESSPLGRTEWVRFYGLLLGQTEKADSLFRATEQRYLELKELVANVTCKPVVFSEKRFGSSWHIPAKDSYIAQIYKDAGADYLFKDLPGVGSIPFSFEAVFEKAIHADLWLIKYNQEEDMTYETLRKEYTPYENFDAFKHQRIYTCNTGKKPYYEEFPIHPDYLLKDLIWLFHPDLLPGYIPRYYSKMQAANF